MNITEVMTPHARCTRPEASLVEAAKEMQALNVGSLPVCENDRLVGIVTDRDIVLRGVAHACNPEETRVRQVMSPEVVYVFSDQSIEEAARLMEVRQIRRLLVLNREKRLVGIVSLGDLSVDGSTRLSGEALREISQPVHAVH